jgi:hypothetical protein
MSPDPIVHWDARTREGFLAAEISIFEESKTPGGDARYLVLYKYHNGYEPYVVQKLVKVPFWQSLNIAGILTAAMLQLNYFELCSDKWPIDEWDRNKGKGSAVPRNRLQGGDDS